MPTMPSVQVRLSEEQLRKRAVRASKYPSHSEAIGDYLRKAQLWEVLERLGAIEDQSDKGIKADLDRIRSEVYEKRIAPRRCKTISRS